MAADTPRAEYPRPQFKREQWLNLNGPWEFQFDEGRMLDGASISSGGRLSDQVRVPFACESALSGIGDAGSIRAHGTPGT